MLTALQSTLEMAPGPGKFRKYCWPFVLALPSSDKHIHLCLPGSSRCRPRGLPCERGISVPRLSGSRHRECHHFFADSVLRGRCHCEILSGTASGPSASLECYEESKEASFNSLHQSCFLGALFPFRPWGQCWNSSAAVSLTFLFSVLPSMLLSVYFPFLGLPPPPPPSPQASFYC